MGATARKAHGYQIAHTSHLRKLRFHRVVAHSPGFIGDASDALVRSINHAHDSFREP
jgi:hypothetical protein